MLSPTCKNEEITLLFTDINECDSKIPVCDDHKDCINTNGSYECRCSDGFEADDHDNCIGIRPPFIMVAMCVQ